MYKKGNYADLSDFALHYIGGILKHAPSLLAFCAPTTNSYKRLVPGFEAPVNIAYSAANRTASVRIPNNYTADRQTDRQTDRQRQTQTDRDTNRQKETDRDRKKKTDTHIHRKTHPTTNTNRHTHTYTPTYTPTPK